MKKFTKSDIKPGMQVITRKGDSFVAIPTTDGTTLINKDGHYIDLVYYDDDLRHCTGDRESWYDIMKIYSLREAPGDLRHLVTAGEKRTLLWDREAEEAKRSEEMKLSDLKPGMRVMLRNGSVGLVVPTEKGLMLVYLTGGYDPIYDGYWGENFRNNKFGSRDIVAVYSVIPKPCGSLDMYKLMRDDFLWKEKDADAPVKMSISEIEKALGKRIELVAEE